MSMKTLNELGVKVCLCCEKPFNDGEGFTVFAVKNSCLMNPKNALAKALHSIWGDENFKKE